MGQKQAPGLPGATKGRAFVSRSAAVLEGLVARKAPSVLHVLLAQLGNERLTRERLAAMAGVTTPTLRRSILDPLLNGRFLDGGPPLRFGPSLLALAVYVGTTHVRAALVDANGQVLLSEVAPPAYDQLRQNRSFVAGRIREVVESIVDRVNAEADSFKVRGALQLVQVSVGWPTPLDRAGYASQTSILDRSWHGQPIKSFVAEALPFEYPVDRIDVMNDAWAAVTTAAFEHSKAQALAGDPSLFSTVLMALRIGGVINVSAIRLPPTVPTRLGFVQASLLVGASGLGGNLGHLPVPAALLAHLNQGRPNGLGSLRASSRCSCGAEGHLESLAAAPGVIGRLPDEEAEALRSQGAMFLRDILRKSLTQDELVERSLADAGRLIAQSLSGAVAVLDPEIVFVSGYLASRPLVHALQEGTPGNRTYCQEAADPDGTAVRRGLALSAFRRMIFRELDDNAAKSQWWMGLPHPVST